MTLRAALVFNTSPHQALWGGYIADGLKRHGIDRVPVQEADFAVCWGERQRKRITRDIPVLVMERGHLQPREEIASIGWNGIGNDAEYPAINDGGGRWEAKFSGRMKPWRNLGDHVLIMGQVRGDRSLKGIDARGWVADTVRGLRDAGEDRIVYRPHPLDAGDGWCPDGARLSKNRRLADDLNAAICAVSFTSTAGVDAVLHGVSHIAGNPASMAWEVSSHSILDRSSRPDREPWAHRLAWTCWTAGEITKGDAWEALRTCLER